MYTARLSSFPINLECAVPENIHTHPQRVIGNSEQEGWTEGGTQKPFKCLQESKLDFPEGLGLGGGHFNAN